MFDALDRHNLIALQLSGGRDSLACLYLLRPEIHRMTVYWVNTGAAYPETIDVIDQVRAWIPRFVEIDGRQPDVIRNFGIPTDILPRSSTHLGVLVGKSTVLMQDSYSCCARVVMSPLHERVLADGCTLIVRGQRNADSHKSPLRSGDMVDGIEMLFPIEGWSDDQVMNYLHEQGAPIPPYYKTMRGAPDCMTCTGWWSEGHGQYLRANHPEAYAIYRDRLRLIAAESQQHIDNFNREMA